MFAIFHEAIRDFFAQTKHAGQTVPVVFASPDRAHGELARVTKRRLQGAKAIHHETNAEPPTATVQAIEDRPASVPFMSLWINTPKFDPARFNPGRFVVEKNVAAGTAQVMRFPRPVTAEVQVDLWCGSRGAHRVAMTLAPQIDLRFYAESVWLPIDWTLDKWYRPPFNVLEHARVLGRTRIRLMVEGGWVDNTDLEVGDGPKEVRWSWTGRFEGYIPYRPSEARLVRSVLLELHDNSQDPPELLVAQDSGSED